ncbi:hypothetical protein ES288_D08G238400v1 [Gossypium darwinii]|uniref:Uncharacterized protein n=1 Tax=Gossypium darwinii TaxID=34276 RepID=A0A5D2BMS7_GOSDA|nr:hypothetical protein ES288_D08G238400v1 [Gossypium darwinii]
MTYSLEITAVSINESKSCAESKLPIGRTCIPRLPLNQIPTSPIILSPAHRRTSMAAYHYRITSKALVIMSVLILAWQLVAARVVPTDHSSAPVIGCNAKGYTPVYGESCPPPNVLPTEHSSAPVIGGNVTGHTSVYGKSGPSPN